MPEFRKDPMTDSWVIIAEERGQRPQDFTNKTSEKNPKEYCPFEPGNEDMTPPEIDAVRPDSGHLEDWNVRIVPNKYPALAIEGNINRQGEGMFDKMNGVGAHEVVIETPNHNEALPDYSDEQMDRILRSYQERISDLKQDQRFKYCLIFKNKGEQAGASLAHPHSQIMAMSVTPKRVKEQLESAREHYMEKTRCLYCDILDQELERDERIVLENREFVVWSPYAARFPFETWIIPKTHHHDFSTIDKKERKKFGSALKSTVRGLRKALQDPPYNFLINTAPYFDSGSKRPSEWHTIEQDYHWHLEIIPRITRIAGFEWGTGFYINPTSPEEAARFLKEETN